MAAVIGRYNYTYGAGDQPNRQVQFSRTGAGANTIQAQVFVLNAAGNVGAQTSTVPGNNIQIEMESTSQKANRMMLARAQNQAYNSLPDESLSNLSLIQQNAIMNSLANRSIGVSNGPIGPGGYEVVSYLNIFDPS